MDLPYFYEVFDEHEAWALSEASQHHVLQVLRMRDGEELYVTNGKGILCHCRLVEVKKKTCAVEILKTTFVPKPNRHFHLAIAFTKNAARMEWLLEKATEIGLEEITPLITSRSEKHFIKKDRLEKILQSAMLQSKQCYIPVLHEPTLFSEVVAQPAENKLIAHCLSGEKKNPLDCISKGASCLAFIGPEGDFTENEIALAEQHHCENITLGNTRLRTETAGLIACAYYQSKQL
jgi:16S rRNA (uracil1498-N3)-methyltransferase